jgi:hypothetical protein
MEAMELTIILQQRRTYRPGEDTPKLADNEARLGRRSIDFYDIFQDIAMFVQ